MMRNNMWLFISVLIIMITLMACASETNKEKNGRRRTTNTKRKDIEQRYTNEIRKSKEKKNLLIK